MRLMHLATTPSGKTFRWGEDEPGAENCFEDLQDSDSVPGGDKEWSCSLPRKPHIDYADMQRGTRIRQYAAGRDRPLREFRLQDAPKTSGDRLVVNPAALGYQAHLSDDESAQEIFIDADFAGWTEPSTQRRANLLALGYDFTKTTTTTGFQDRGSAGPALIFEFSAFGSLVEIGELWYYGGGVDIGAFLFDFIVPKAGGEASNVAFFGSDDVATPPYVESKNYGITAAANQQLVAPANGYKYVGIQSGYPGAFTGTSAGDTYGYAFPKVLGRHGLPIYGTWPNVGVLFSDVIAYALGKWAPFIDFTTGPNGSIRPTNFPIPHLAFKELGTVMQMAEQGNRFELNEWAVWAGRKGPTFYLNPRGEREGRKRWRVRSREAQLKDTGTSFDSSANAVVVVWQGFDGVTRLVGPPGSGLSLTDTRLLDADPLNPVNQIPGLRKYKKIATKRKGTLEGAIETGQRYLEQIKLLDNSGDATLTGYIEDEHGMLWPYHYAKSGDLLDPLDGKGDRYMVSASRTRASRSASVFLDAPPDTREAMLERLDVEELAEGFN